MDPFFAIFDLFSTSYMAHIKNVFMTFCVLLSNNPVFVCFQLMAILLLAAGALEVTGVEGASLCAEKDL